MAETAVGISLGLTLLAIALFSHFTESNGNDITSFTSCTAKKSKTKKPNTPLEKIQTTKQKLKKI